MTNGLGIALGLVLLVLLLYVLGGSRRFEANNTTFQSVVVVYLTSGIIGGAMAGLLRPLICSLLGSICVGVIIAFFTVSNVVFSMRGDPRAWQAEVWMLIFLVSVVLGSLTAGMFWNMFGRRD